MNRRVALRGIVGAFTALTGCVQDVPVGSSSDDDSTQSTPNRPETLNATTALKYSVKHQESIVYNEILARAKEQGLANPEIKVGCYGGVEQRTRNQYYIILECGGSIDHSDQDGGGGGGGGGSAGAAVYLITDESTKRASLRSGIDPDQLPTVTPAEDRNTTKRKTVISPQSSLAIVNFDDESHDLSVSITSLSTAEKKVQFSHEYSLDASDGVEQLRTVLRDGKYKITVSTENSPEKTLTWTPGTKFLYEVAIYIRPSGELEIHEASYSPTTE